jgi:hypothetical protein
MKRTTISWVSFGAVSLMAICAMGCGNSESRSADGQGGRGQGDLASKLAVLRRPRTPHDRLDEAPGARDAVALLFDSLSADDVRFLGLGPGGERFYLVRGQLKRQREGSRLTVVWVDGTEVGAAGSADLRGLLSNRTVFSKGSGRRTVVGGLVPDGVASVEVRYRGRRPLTVDVRENFWVARASGSRRFLPAVTWKDADGATIRAFPRV